MTNPFILGPGNSPGTDGKRGVAGWRTATGSITASPDYGYVQPGGSITLAVLGNDTGDSLTVTNAVLNGSPGGSVSFTATHVTFNTLTDFDMLAPGEYTQVVLTYTIQDAIGQTASTSIYIQVEQPAILWADEDGLVLADQDNTALES